MTDAAKESFTPTVSSFDTPGSFGSQPAGKPSAPSCSSGIQLLSELEPQYAGQAAEAHGVRDDDNDVVLENAVKHPRPHAGGKNAEHQEGQIPRLAGLPALLQLRKVRDRGAKGCEEPDKGSSVHSQDERAYVVAVPLRNSRKDSL